MNAKNYDIDLQLKVGKIIQARREKLRMMQVDLAKKINVSNQSLCKWECAEVGMTLSNFQKVMKALGMTLDDFKEAFK